MSFSAVIAKPEYDNVITANPQGSAYAYSASTGVLDANFAGTIGTADSIQILTQGYQFAWKPDTVNVLDDQGNLTLLDNVNANATAQVWNNKITYVGTTAATSDEFVVEGNQLKHSVRMVAPPTLPSGYTGTPQFLAIGGDIGTTAEDWASIDLWADGTTHLTDFVTSDDLKFCLKSDGTEIYRIPKITVTDDAGNEVNGQYKLVFGANNVVTLYMLCPWSWMQSATYPIIIDPTVIVSSAYDISGNGGRKIVRLSNNWIVVTAYNSTAYQIDAYVSKDNGQTWAQLCYMSAGQSGVTVSHSIASSGTIVYVLATLSTGTATASWVFDATTVANTSQPTSPSPDSAQSSFGTGVSLTFDGQGNLHAAWCSKNSTYANSYNIRYSKGTVSGTTVTWATPTQITNYNSSTINATNPCIAVNSNNQPIIVLQFANTSTPDYGITCYTYNGTTWSAVVATKIYDGASYTQSNPCGAIDSNGVIHVVWTGQASPEGGGSGPQIFYSKSTDGGNTWSAVAFITTESYTQRNPTITIDQNNKLYVFFEGEPPNDTGFFSIRMVTNTGGTWSAVTTIYNPSGSYNATNAQSLWSEFNMNSSDAVRMIYSDAQAGAVEYYTIALDSPPNAPSLNPVANFDATKSTTFSWTFSDPDPGDSQSAFQLQILDVAAGTTAVDTGKVASTNTSYTVAANTLSNAKQYQWRVTTWDSSGQQGPYSAYSTFSTASAPTVSITSPASGATVATSSVTVSWSYSDPANNAQQSFDVQLLDSTDATVLVDSGTVTSSGNQYTIQYTLANNTNYNVKVTVTNSKGVSNSNTIAFSTAFTPPATPTLTSTADSTNARLTISITNPSGTPTVASNSLYRKNSGTSTWNLIASNLSPNSTYEDYTVGSEQAYDYKVTAYANNGTQTDSALLTASVTFSGDWVYNPTSGQQFQFLYNRKAYAMAITEERKEVQTFGTKPMVRRGPLNARTGTLDALMVKVGTGQTPIQQLQAFEADMAPHNAYYLKTAAGEVFKVDLYQSMRAMPSENLNNQAIGISVNWTEIA